MNRENVRRGRVAMRQSALARRCRSAPVGSVRRRLDRCPTCGCPMAVDEWAMSESGNCLACEDEFNRAAACGEAPEINHYCYPV